MLGMLAFLLGACAVLAWFERAEPIGRGRFFLLVQLCWSAGALLALAQIGASGLPTLLLAAPFAALGGCHALAVAGRCRDARLGRITAMMAGLLPPLGLVLLLPRPLLGEPCAWRARRPRELAALLAGLVVMVTGAGLAGQAAVPVLREDAVARIVQGVREAGGTASWDGATLALVAELDGLEPVADQAWLEAQHRDLCAQMAPLLQLGAAVRIEMHAGGAKLGEVQASREACAAGPGQAK